MMRNYCTVTLAVNPEVDRHDGLTVHYSCEKGRNLVRGCSHYRPMKCCDGTVCEGECQHYRKCSCWSKSARDEARARARRIVGTWL